MVSLYSTIPSPVLSFIWLLSIPSLSFMLTFVQVLSPSSMVLITVWLFSLIFWFTVVVVVVIGGDGGGGGGGGWWW